MFHISHFLVKGCTVPSLFVAIDALAGAAEAGDEGGKGEDLCVLTNA